MKMEQFLTVKRENILSVKTKIVLVINLEVVPTLTLVEVLTSKEEKVLGQVLEVNVVTVKVDGKIVLT